MTATETLVSSRLMKTDDPPPSTPRGSKKEQKAGEWTIRKHQNKKKDQNPIQKAPKNQGHS